MHITSLLAHPVPLAFPHLLAVAVPCAGAVQSRVSALARRSVPPPAMSKQGAFLSLLDPVIVWCRLVGFFFAYRGGLTRRPGPGRGGFCFAGGKAKPLKAPKADKKEYDEVCWTLLSFHYAVLD